MDLSLEAFVAQDESAKAEQIKDCAILYAQQFNRQDLDGYCRLADVCRALHRQSAGADFMANLLPHRMALNFFVQPSSRTFMSFNAAQIMLGMKRMSVRDIAISSISKGETLADSVRTFMSYVDCIVMRHADEHAGDIAVWIAMHAQRRIRVDGRDRPIPIINAGSGSKQHPTQALLDIYTLEKAFENHGGIDGKTLMLVGDLKRGRTVRSLAYLMQNYRDVTLLFAAPDEYQMAPDILAFLDRHAIKWEKIESISAGIARADATYMTRIQDEWDGLAKGVHTKAGTDFRFTLDHLKAMPAHAALLHPLPKRDEIDAAIDYVDDPRVVYWRQERNGMWMRVAILARLFRLEPAILGFARSQGIPVWGSDYLGHA